MNRKHLGSKWCNVKSKEHYIAVIILFIILLIVPNATKAQDISSKNQENSVVTNSFWDNWYMHFGLDMTLLNPYGCNFSNVFPNGKSFGVNIGLGKWFSPEFGLRGRISWENGIFKNNNAKWLSPSNPGYNHEKGGFATASLDIQINMHNLLNGYNPERMWNLILYPRLGAISNFSANETGPLLGVGIGNTFRLNKKWKIATDVSYQAMPTVLGYVTSTGTGNNGYIDVSIGLQYNIGNDLFYHPYENVDFYRHAVHIASFRNNWFAQTGLGMSLMNLYGSNFANVFPNGKTFGVNIALGKWFTPEVAVRCGINWQNGIIGNNHLSWLDSEGLPGSNHDGGGFGVAYVDVFLNMHNLICGYYNHRKWNTILFPRAGINSNFESGSASPLLGLGIEQTYSVNKRISIFTDIAYQLTTGELMGKKSKTGEGSNSNGWFDFNIGLQFNLGKNKGEFIRLRE